MPPPKSKDGRSSGKKHQLSPSPNIQSGASGSKKLKARENDIPTKQSTASPQERVSRSASIKSLGSVTSASDLQKRSTVPSSSNVTSPPRSQSSSAPNRVTSSPRNRSPSGSSSASDFRYSDIDSQASERTPSEKLHDKVMSKQMKLSWASQELSQLRSSRQNDSARMEHLEAKIKRYNAEIAQLQAAGSTQ